MNAGSVNVRFSALNTFSSAALRKYRGCSGRKHAVVRKLSPPGLFLLDPLQDDALGEAYYGFTAIFHAKQPFLHAKLTSEYAASSPSNQHFEFFRPCEAILPPCEADSFSFARPFYQRIVLVGITHCLGMFLQQAGSFQFAKYFHSVILAAGNHRRKLAGRQFSLIKS